MLKNPERNGWDRAIDAPPIFLQAKHVIPHFFQAKDKGQKTGKNRKIKNFHEKMKKTPQKHP
jgi:hypothetical protein